ncbi:MAG: translation elongation factor Ts, partial [Planktotalea arctica]
MAITAAMVKELRDTSGAGMMDAKKALTETAGDMEAAIDWLRTKGLAKAAKKSGRTAAEGLVAVAVTGGKGVAVEVNSETDFVGKNAEFQEMVGGIAATAMGVSDVEALAAADMGGKSVADVLNAKIATIGENMSLRRMAVVESTSVVSYVHNAVTGGMGKIGVLVGLSGENEAFGKQVAMHIADANPVSLSEADLDPAVVEQE